MMGNYEDVTDVQNKFYEAERSVSDFFRLVCANVKCSRPEDLAPEVLNQPANLKSHLSAWLSRSCGYLIN